MKAYSMDLRTRVLAASDKGMGTAEVAETFGVARCLPSPRLLAPLGTAAAVKLPQAGQGDCSEEGELRLQQRRDVAAGVGSPEDGQLRRPGGPGRHHPRQCARAANP